jgi:hypothetical protein
VTVGRLLALLAAVAAAALAPILLGRPASGETTAAPAARAPARLGGVAAPGAPVSASRRSLPAPVGQAAPVVVVAGEAPVRPPPPRPRAPPPGPTAVSRRFVVAYAAFVYGRLPAADLPDLSPRLRRQVDALHPQPADAVVAAADPRLRSLRVASGRPGRARALAVIDDGPAVYTIALDLRRRPSGWTIAGLAETG